MSSTTGLTILSAREEEKKIKMEEDNDWYNITKSYYK